MRISDWISDVCSSDLRLLARAVARRIEHHHVAARQLVGQQREAREIAQLGLHAAGAIGAPGSSIERRQRVLGAARNSLVEGKSVSVRVDLVGPRIITKTNISTT